MKVTLIGGGGFRAPLAYTALRRIAERVRIEQVVLHDRNAERLARIEGVLSGLDAECGARLPRMATTDLEEAVDGAAFVLCAIRVGGLASRAVDETIPLAHGVIGQETTGPGGIAYALRTVPIMLDIARVVARRAPRAWFINFTNPVGLVTEALQPVLGERAIGVCDTPIGLCRRVARALGRDPEELWFSYFGLNHLGWLAAVRDRGVDRLPALLADAAALESIEEAQLFGVEWLRSLGMIPNEYLVYYYAAGRVLQTVAARGYGRAEYLLQQQARFYDGPHQMPAEALAAWRAATAERDRTYLAEGLGEARPAATGEPADDSAGYAGVAADLIDSLERNTRSVMILNTANRRSLPGLDAQAVVEVPCVVGSSGPMPLAVETVPDHARALLASVKAVERATIEAAVSGSQALALKALALHPLVPSVDVAGRMLRGYLDAEPLLRARLPAA